MRRGHLEERRPGVWRYRISAGTSARGTAVQRSKTFPASSRRAAEKIATAVQKDWDDQDEFQLAQRGTLAELVREWVEFRAKKDSPSTVYRRQSITNRIVAELGHVRLADLTARHIDRWYNELQHPTRRGVKPMSANTVGHYHRVLHAILEQGYLWDMLVANVADKARPPEKVHHDQAEHMPTVAAVAVMLVRASPSVRMAVLLAAATGCRRGELVGLRWSDIDGPTLHVRRAHVKVPGSDLVVKTPKNGKPKTILLNPSLLEQLSAFRQWQHDWIRQAGGKPPKDGPILAHLRADISGRTAFTPDWLSQEWDRLCTRSKVKPFKFHGLRHMHGSMLVDHGVSLATAAKRQGHASVSTMAEFYTHPIDESDIRAAEIVEEMLAPLFELPAGRGEF